MNTKQRMRRRLIYAICYHDPDLGFEFAVMGDQCRLWTMTHKQLKALLKSKASLKRHSSMGVTCYDGAGGRISLYHPSDITTAVLTAALLKPQP